jgi:hypothetical protein
MELSFRGKVLVPWYFDEDSDDDDSDDGVQFALKMW